MAKDETIKIKRVIQATPGEVYAAFTHASSLTEWMCSVAEADDHPGGRLYLWWNTGYYASGEYISLVPGERITFSWHGRNEPGITQVRVDLKTLEDGSTKLTLTHSQIGSGKTWRQARKAYRDGWKTSLENLQSVLETGMDLRFVRRPVFGLSGVDKVDGEMAASLGLPVKYGLLVEGVIAGMGAETAGLKSGDILVRLGGKKISGYDTLVMALQGYHAGDKIKFSVYRGSEKITGKAVLAARPLPEVPFDPEGLADAVEKNHHMLDLELGRALEHSDDQHAAYRPAPDEWNAKENLAHLVAGERDLQAWITSLIEGQDSSSIFHTNQTARLGAMVAAFSSMKALVAEFKRSQTETVALLRSLPAELASRKGTFWRMGYQLLTLPDHVREHIGHIQLLLDAAKQLPVEPEEHPIPEVTGEQE
jgi:uncharacterized protein YndB with AHSA1/START domain